MSKKEAADKSTDHNQSTHAADAEDLSRRVNALHGEEGNHLHHLLHRANNANLHHVEISDPTRPAGSEKTHHVKQGETVSEIARHALGPHASIHDVYNFVNEIAKANQLQNPDHIRAGSTLQIPEYHQPAHHGHHHGHHHAGPEQHPAHNGSTDQQPGKLGGTQGDTHRPPQPPPSGDGQKPQGGDGHKPQGGDGQKPQGGDGHKPQGGDGQNKPQPPGQQHQPAEQKPAEKPIDRDALKQDADAIRKMTGNDNLIARWADKKGINDLLQNRTQAERDIIDSFYKQKYHVGVEEEVRKFEKGSDLDKFLSVWKRKDGDINSQNADRIHTALDERKELWTQRSNSEIEKDIRDTLRSSNADQIAAMDKSYREKYGVGMREALMNDPKLSQETKAACDVYLKGNDKRTDADTARLIDSSLIAKNSKMFAEVMKDASPAARKNFLDNGGEQRCKDAFDHLFSSTDFQHALDEAKTGGITTVDQVKDNTGVIGLTTNSQGIEHAIKSMTDDERQKYDIGYRLAHGETMDNVPIDRLHDAMKYYSDLHQAFTKAGNSTDVAKWEAEASGSTPSLIAGMEEHHHWWRPNDSVSDISKDIENMSQQDWQTFKQHPEKREELKQMLQSIKGPEDVDALMHTFDNKMKPDDWNQAKDAVKRPITQILDEDVHWYRNDRRGAVDAISQMSQRDQEMYRTNESFRKQVDDKIKDVIKDGPAYDEARRMLDEIKAGKAPTKDIITQLREHASDFNTDRVQAVLDIEKAFRDKPDLRRMITNPQNDSERQYAEDFKKAAGQTFGSVGSEQLLKPLLETGHVPLLSIAPRCDSNEKLYDALQYASADDLKAMQNNPYQKNMILERLSGDQRQVAENIMKQGQENPADKIRAAVVGWGGSDEIKSTIEGLNPQQLDQLRHDYAGKYGSLDADLDKKLSGQDKADVQKALSGNILTDEEKFNLARDDFYSTRSGFGAWMSDNVWRSATGSQADESMNQMTQLVSDAHKQYQNVPHEQMAQYQAQVEEAIVNHKEAKAAAAEYVSDAVIAGAAVASVIATGGADLPLVVALAAGGAAVKVGSKKLFMGNDYDPDAAELATDGTIGAITGATSVLGPGELAAVFKVGETAAMTAAKATVTELGEQTVKTMLKEGGEEALQTGTKKLMQETLASGAKEINPKEITKLAEKVVSQDLTGEAREKAVQELSTKLQQNLQTQLREETKNYYQTIARRELLNAGGGAAGGGASGAGQGLTEWDSNKSFAENMGHIGVSTLAGAGSGAIGAVGLGNATRIAGHGFAAVREGAGFLKPGESGAILDRAQQLFRREGPAIKTDSGEFRFNEDGRLARAKSEHQEVRISYNRDGTPKRVQLDNGNEYSFVDGTTWKVKNAAHPEGAKVKGALSVGHDGTVVFKADNAETIVHSINGPTKIYDAAGNIASLSKEGLITESSATNGKHLEFTHESGNLQKIEYPDGSTAERLGKNKWMVKTDADPAGHVIDGERSIRGDGAAVWKTPEGNEQVTLANGAKTVTDPNGKVIETWSTDGRHVEYEYENGELVSFRDSTAEWTRNGHVWEFKKAGSGKTGWEAGTLEVLADGSPRWNRGDHVTVARLDGTTEIYERNGRLVKEISRDGKQISGLDFDDRQTINDGFADVSRYARNRPFVINDLKEVTLEDGRNLYDALVENNQLSAAQRDRILDTLGDVREHFVRQREGGKFVGVAPPEANVDPVTKQAWAETRTQLARVVEAGQSKGLSPNELEDAVLATIYSRSLPGNAKQLALTPEAAKMRLTNAGYPEERAARIAELMKQTSSGERTTDPLLPDKTFLNKLAPDFDKLSADEQRALLKKLSVPENPAFAQLPGAEQEKILSQYKVSQVLADARDSQNAPVLHEANDYESVNSGRREEPRPIKERIPQSQAEQLKIPKATGKPKETPEGALTPIDGGSMFKKKDGSILIADTARGISRQYDAKGHITEAFENGKTRTFSYANGRLSEVHMEDGTIFKRSGNKWSEWSPSGEQKILEDTKIVVDADGAVKKVEDDHFFPKVERSSLDGNKVLYKANGRVEYLEANYAFEHQHLSDRVHEAFAKDPQRLARFEQLQNKFEQESTARGLSVNEKATFYQQINRLIADDPAAVIALDQRMDLAEQAMNHAAEPTTIDQGQNSSCNVTTVEHRLYATDPAKNVQALADIAHSGKYVTADGHTVDMSKLDFGVKPDAEARKSLDLQHDSSQQHIKQDADRDFSSQLLQLAMINSKWQSRAELITEDGRILQKDTNFAYGPDKKLKGILFESDKLQRLYNEKGDRLYDWKPGMQAYDKDGKLLPPVDQSKVVYDAWGRARGQYDQPLKPVYDAYGNEIKGLVPTKGYDANGNVIYNEYGNIRYDKIANGPGDNDGLILTKPDGTELRLRNARGKFESSPNLSIADLEGISNQVSGKQESGFAIIYGKETKSWGAYSEVSTTEDLIKMLDDLRSEKKLPAIVHVDATKPPFNTPPSPDGNGHVINIYGVKKVETAPGQFKYVVEFTNQWGSKHDYLGDRALDLDIVFAAMKGSDTNVTTD